MYLLKFKQIIIESISHLMIPHISMLQSCMKSRILTKVNGVLVITVYHIALLLKPELMYEMCETKVWLILILMITKQGLELMTIFQV